MKIGTRVPMKMGTWSPQFGGPHFHMTPVLYMELLVYRYYLNHALMMNTTKCDLLHERDRRA